MLACLRRSWTAALGLSLGVSSAIAGEPGAQDRARLPALIRAGKDAANAKNWDACTKALTAAAEIDGAATTWGELGLCEEGAGSFVSAYEHLRRALLTAQEGSREQARYRAASSRIAAERIALVFVTVTPQGTRTLIDGKPLGAVNGRSVPLEPGPHVFTGVAPGFDSARESRTLKAGDVSAVHLMLSPKRAEPIEPTSTTIEEATPPEAPSREPEPPKARRVEHVSGPGIAGCLPNTTARGVLTSLMCASMAVTVLGAATSIGLEVARADLRRDLPATACDPEAPSDPARCAAIHDRRNQRNAALYVTFGAAGTVILSGVATALAIRLGREPLRPSIAPTVSTQGGGVIVSGAF